MKEYFIICLLSIVAVFFIDIRLNTRLFFMKKFWIFQGIVVLLTTIVDDYSSGRPFVLFNTDVMLNVRILHVPLENYLFGFSLLALNLILYEYYAQKRKK